MLKSLKVFALTCAIGIFCVSNGYANLNYPNSDHWTWRNSSSLQYVFSSYGDTTHIFHGTMTLYGTLVIENENRQINLTFFPNSQSMNHLPHTEEYGKAEQIYLNRSHLDRPVRFDHNSEIISAHKPLIDNKVLVQRAFSDIPSGFWQSQNAKIVRSAAIDITEFAVSVECDWDSYHATVISIRPLNTPRTNPKIQHGC